MNFFTGFVIGIFSLIPGISSGTILLALKKYDYITKIINDWQHNIRNLVIILSGIILGVITFSKILELLFLFIPNEIMLLFAGFILFNIPKLINDNNKLKILGIILGILIVIILNMLSFTTPKVIITYPKITFIFLIYFGICGSIDGFFTIIPGISGSMIMMILGPYFLYKSYLAHLNITNLIFLIPLSFYFIGDLIGFYLGSKFSNYCIKKYQVPFFSIILGMVLASTIIILPFNFILNNIVLTSIILLISYIISNFFT